MAAESSYIKNNVCGSVVLNDGTGTPTYGNYYVKSYKATKYAAEIQPRQLWRTGRIEEFPRHLGVHHLLREAITSLLNERRDEEPDDEG